jgi:pyridoxal phosphate enzyme (YggS family)
VLKDRYQTVEERVHNACARAGRSRAEITLVAVTKVFPAEFICEAHALGLRDFGENYVQEFAAKYPAVEHLEGARFHLIGHLQSNKATKAAELFHVIQTVDSTRLARRLDAVGRPLQVWVEVKLSPEETKHGAAPEILPELIKTLREYPNLILQGLMTVPPWSEDAEVARPYFQQLRELAQQHQLTGLSMGMSNDLEVAIEEGATCIRIGTALFGSRKRPA